MLKQGYKRFLKFVNEDSRDIIMKRIFRRQIKKIVVSTDSLEPEYNKKIDEYWINYNLKIKKDWHRWYSSRNNNKDVRYIPEDIFYSEILPFFNELKFKEAYCDKSILSIWFPDVNTPKTIVNNMSGGFFNENFEQISEHDAINRCISKEKVIIKPSIDSGGGRDIRLIQNTDLKTMKNEIMSIMSKFKKNYIIQEVIDQHNEFKKINPSSVNTIRVISFAYQGEIHILSSVLRMGVNDAVVDNQGAGGISCAITKEGKLNQYAYDKYGQALLEHPNGYVFKNRIVPSYNDAIDIVKREHSKFGHFALISWDFAIDEKSQPILIEYNLGFQEINFHQLGNGPLFGELTDEVLQEVLGGRGNK